jgi:hypothetical protein
VRFHTSSWTSSGRSNAPHPATIEARRTRTRRRASLRAPASEPEVCEEAEEDHGWYSKNDPSRQGRVVHNVVSDEHRGEPYEPARVQQPTLPTPRARLVGDVGHSASLRALKPQIGEGFAPGFTKPAEPSYVEAGADGFLNDERSPRRTGRQGAVRPPIRARLAGQRKRHISGSS